MRYRNLIRSILIKACNIDDDVSIDSDIDFYLPDSNTQGISISRRNRILATQVVKAIKSRKGRFLQRVTTSSSSSKAKRYTSASNHIERIVYKEVEESIAIEKTKQNFRDQMRQLQMEQHGMIANTDSLERPLDDSWALPSSRNPSSSSVTGGKRKRTNEDHSCPSESFLNVRNKVTRGFSSARPPPHDILAIHNYDILANPVINSCEFQRTSAFPDDSSFYRNNDLIMESVLSQQHAAPSLSRIGYPREHDPQLSHRHLPTRTHRPFIPEVNQVMVYRNTRPQLLEDHLRIKSNHMILHGQPLVGYKNDVIYHDANMILSLDGQIREREMLSHRLVASSSKPSTIMPTIISHVSSNHCPLPPLVVAPRRRPTQRVEAMIASHQTRRNKFWMGWANASK